MAEAVRPEISPTDGPVTTELPPPEDVPRLRIDRTNQNVAPGHLFLAPQSILAPDAPHGPQIVDPSGRVVWFLPIPKGQYATDVRAQTYQGEPVLTWWQGEATIDGAGKGACYIADRHYRIIAVIRSGGEHQIDLHEFELTERGTALIISYQVKPCDLSPIGGPEDGNVLDSVIEEIDVATGEVLLHWSGVERIPLNESDMPVALANGGAYDHLHVNAVSVDDDGHLVATARSSSAIFKIHRESGEVLWKLGSGYSTFRLDTGARCFWPHDAQPVGDGVYRVFDNGTNDYMEGYESRVVWVRADTETGVASYVRHLVHPNLVSSLREGNSQQLPNGNVLIGWGGAARISEFDPDGQLVFDARLPDGPGWSTYRAYRHEWHGRPLTPPTAVPEGNRVRAVWNGATDVAHWRVLAGPTPQELRTVRTVAWDGFDTAIELPAGTDDGYVRVRAIDAEDELIAESEVTPIGSSGRSE